MVPSTRAGAGAAELLAPQGWSLGAPCLQMPPAKRLRRPAATAKAKAAPKQKAEASGVTGSKGKKREGPAKKADEVSPSSFVAFVDVTTGRGEERFSKWASRVVPGLVVVAPVYDSSGLALGHCILQVIQAIMHKSGLYLEADLGSWSTAEVRAEMRGVKEGGDVLVHLCKSGHACKDTFHEGKVVHLREWKVVEPRQLDEEYVTAAQRRYMEKMAPEPQAWNVTFASADEEAEVTARPPNKRVKMSTPPARLEPSRRKRPASDSEAEPPAKRKTLTVPGTLVDHRSRRATAPSDEDDEDDSQDEEDEDDDGGGVSISKGVDAHASGGGTGLMARLMAKMQAGGAKPAEDGAKSSTPLKSASVDELKEMLAAKKASTSRVRAKRVRSSTTGHPPASGLLSRIQALQDAPREARQPTAEEDDFEPSRSSASRRRKRSRSRRRRRSRRSSGSETSRSRSSGDRDAQSLFGLAERGGNGLSNKLVHLARNHPGTLLRSTLTLMHQKLKPGDAPLGKNTSPPIVHKFLQQVTLAQNSVKGRDLRELSTLALACDHVLSGRLEEGLEVLLQRYKRVEAQAINLLPGAEAENLEITDLGKDSSLSLAERELATSLTNKWQKYVEKTGPRRPSE